MGVALLLGGVYIARRVVRTPAFEYSEMLDPIEFRRNIANPIIGYSKIGSSVNWQGSSQS